MTTLHFTILMICLGAVISIPILLIFQDIIEILQMISEAIHDSIVDLKEEFDNI
jgi:hypothetical protein